MVTLTIHQYWITLLCADLIGRVRNNSGGKREAYYQLQVTQVNAGHFLISQVPDQWISTGSTPEWSDSEEPAEKVTADLSVINWLVLSLPFSTAIFCTLPIQLTTRSSLNRS